MKNFFCAVTFAAIAAAVAPGVANADVTEFIVSVPASGLFPALNDLAIVIKADGTTLPGFEIPEYVQPVPLAGGWGITGFDPTVVIPLAFGEGPAIYSFQGTGVPLVFTAMENGSPETIKIGCLGDNASECFVQWGDGDNRVFNAVLDYVPMPSGASLPVPETSTWAMMVIGFVSLGYLALQRRREVPVRVRSV